MSSFNSLGSKLDAARSTAIGSTSDGSMTIGNSEFGPIKSEIMKLSATPEGKKMVANFLEQRGEALLARLVKEEKLGATNSLQFLAQQLQPGAYKGLVR